MLLEYHLLQGRTAHRLLSNHFISSGRRVILLRVTVLVQLTAQPHIHSQISMMQSKILRARPISEFLPLLVDAHLPAMPYQAKSRS